MNDQKLERKIRQDATRVVRDVSTLAGDSMVRLGRLDENISQAAGKAKEDVTSWVENGVSQMSHKLENLADDARETMTEAAVAVEKDVKHGLNQYNSKVNNLVEKVPGGLGDKAARYPWVAVTIALAIGFLLGSLTKPFRRLLWQP